MTTLSPPLKWHGGKHYLADRIIALMPKHTHYVEPYFGGGAVLLRKNPEGVSEVVNDLNGELTHFWMVLQQPSEFEKFRRVVEATPFIEIRQQMARVDPAERVRLRDEYHDRKRTSMSNFGARAWKMAEALRQQLQPAHAA